MRPADTQKRSSRYKMTKVFISSRLSLHCSTIIVQIIQFFFCVFPVRSCFHEPVDGQQVSCKLSVGLGSFFVCVGRHEMFLMKIVMHSPLSSTWAIWMARNMSIRRAMPSHVSPTNSLQKLLKYKSQFLC